MQTYNKIITVEVSVDAIANQLLNTFNTEFPHREMLTEAIIGTGLNNMSLTYLYNALNGFTNGVNFFIEQIVECKETAYNPNHPNKTPRSDYVEIGKCKIVEINLYQSNKIMVEYTTYTKEGEQKKDTKWVSHLNLSSYSSQE